MEGTPITHTNDRELADQLMDVVDRVKRQKETNYLYQDIVDCAYNNELKGVADKHYFRNLAHIDKQINERSFYMNR